jgi:trehalose 6-phosphate phosphatase
VVVGLDFDGTLAPIVAEPELARPDSMTLELLEALGKRLRQLALISGRDSDQLAELVPLPEITLIGNHGLEQRRMGRAQLSPMAEPFRANLERAASAIRGLPEMRHSGVRIEGKRAAISVHYRLADSLLAGPELERALRPLAEREGLRLHPGRFVWELRPAVDINKGSVIRGLAASLRPDVLIYAGDDITDADALGALRDLSHIRTLGVGVLSAEVPSATFKDADLLVDGVEGVKAFLGDLLAIGQAAESSLP